MAAAATRDRVARRRPRSDDGQAAEGWRADLTAPRERRALLARGPLLVSSEGLCPSDSPTRSLARRFDGALRSRGSLAALVRVAICEMRTSPVLSAGCSV